MKIKNNLAFIFIFFLCLFIAQGVNAAPFTVGTTHGTEDPNSLIINETKTLTINNVPNTDTLTAYKIIDAFYNPTTNAVYYEFTSDFKSFIASSNNYRSLTLEAYQRLTSGSLTSGDINSTSSLDTLASSYASYINQHSISGTDLTKNSTYQRASLPIGSYLILPKVTNKVYAVMVGNLDITEENGDWVAHDSTIVAKVSEPGVITKTMAGNKETDSAYYNREITYNITGSVPKYPTNATNKEYMITDTMSSGLTFLGLTNLSISDGTTRLTVASNGDVTDTSGNKVATITVNNATISIDFNLDYIKSTQINITYKAKLNDQAILGSAGNKNSAKLTYSNDPYGTNVMETDEEITTMYTYGIEILKYSGNNKGAVLSGASFDVFSNAGLTTKIGTLETDENGQAFLKGIPAGTYYLKETKAPKDHDILENTLTINVGTNGSESASNPGYYLLEISNNKNMFLPFTGGMGTYIYTIIGLSIIIIAVIIFIIYRKRRERKDNDEK